MMSSLTGFLTGATEKAAEAAAAAGEPASKLEQIRALAEQPHSTSGTYWLPEAASVTADEVDWMFYGTLGLSIFCFVAITIAVVYFVIKYRARDRRQQAEPSAHHNDTLEITWTVIPSIIVIFLFLYGWRGYIRMATPPDSAMEVQVVASQWNWSFLYPNGVQTDVLYIPENENVRLSMTSTDVLHSFWAPAFRTKQDVVPRRYTRLWFKATKRGVYRLYCTEYCGAAKPTGGGGGEAAEATPAEEGASGADDQRGHSTMKTKVVVLSKGDFDDFLRLSKEESMNLSPAELGERLYSSLGCNACHTTDGTPKVGPSFKGTYGTEVEISGGGKVTIDDDYIRESLLEPQAKIRSGFPPSMPMFQPSQLTERNIQGLIAYIKSLNEE